MNVRPAPMQPDFRAGARYLSRGVAPRLDDLWLIRDWVPVQGLSVLWGLSGVGKSHLAADMAAHVATGRDWHGHPVEPGFVAYLALEGHGSLDNRIAALARTFGDGPVWFMPAPFSLIEATDHAEELARTIAAEAKTKGLPVRWVIVDTLARAMSGMEENSAKDMGAAIAALGAITRTLDCAVTVVHHAGKDATRGERGSGALRAAAEASIEVSSSGHGAAKVVTATAGKQRDAPDDVSLAFRLRQVELGEDKWGRTVTSCSVEPLTEAEAAARRSVALTARLTERQRDALEALRDAAEAHGRRVTHSPDYPASRRIVAEGDWRDEFYRRVVLKDEVTDEAEARKKAFQRARADLKEKGLVGHYDGHFWTVQEGGT
jgi:hypothetical protein